MARIPKFSSEQDESEFWAIHDSTDYFDDIEEVKDVHIEVRPRMEQIALRLPTATIASLKYVAKKKGVGYQTLIRMWVTEKLDSEEAYVKSKSKEIISPQVALSSGILLEAGAAVDQAVLALGTNTLEAIAEAVSGFRDSVEMIVGHSRVKKNQLESAR